MIISANEVKRRGVSILEKYLKKGEEIYITVRGKKKFVVLPVEEYERLKEAELESFIRQAEEDYKEGRYIVESAEEHFKRLGL